MFKKIGAILACAFLTASVGACSGVNAASQSDQKTFTVAVQPGYDDTNAVTRLWEELLSEHGYKLQAKEVDLAAGYAGVARGDLDGYFNAWLPTTHETYVEKYRDKLDIIGPYYENDRLVLVAPKSVPENTISEVVANASTYGSKVVGIEDGSGEMKLLPSVLEKYGAQDKLNIVAGSTPATLAALKDAAANNKPLVATLWKPHWAFSSMPIKVLEDDMGGWPKPDGSYSVLSKDFAAKNPEMATWMSKFKLTDEQYESLMLDVSQASGSVEGAKKWLQDPENRKTADSWFAGS